jgi:chaperonin subunit
VLFGKYSGQEIRLDGKDYFIMKEDDVLAVIDGPVANPTAAAGTPAAVSQKNKKK